MFGWLSQRNRKVSLQIQASNSDGDPMSYDAIGLSPGLSINSSTGLISGTVASGAAEDFGGSYNPTIIVSDAHGPTAKLPFPGPSTRPLTPPRFPPLSPPSPIRRICAATAGTGDRF